ncbi:alpha/beta fold hydrolase [Citricoccus sp. GCM10030269]|uniref:alpha/beta fold hydrolase n=1 Tax=Citricoccus sp. GCM10030269 TaxID=3273388 RepID=UPI00361F98AB
MTRPSTSSRPTPIRWRDRIRVPPSPRDTSIITGFAARTPERIMVEVPDPQSGRPTPVAVWHYPVESGTRAPLIGVHGFRGDHHGLALLADCLPDHEIFLPELPGFGHSPAFPDAEHTVAHYVAALQDALEALELLPTVSTGRRAAASHAELPRPTLLGHSFGSVIASHLAASAPERWAGLTLLNPICEPALTADDSTSKVVLSRLAESYYGVSAALPDPLGKTLLSSPLVVWLTGTVMAKTEDRNTLAYLHDQHQSYFSAFDHRKVLLEAYRASTHGSVLDVAQQLRLPVLLVAGAQDELGSVRGQRKLARRIGRVSPAVQLEVLDGVGHLIHYERAAEAAGLIQEFRQNLDGNTDSASRLSAASIGDGGAAASATGQHA